MSKYKIIMEISQLELTIRDLVNGYKDSQEEGVFGFNNHLNIRPKYQREFVYNDKQRKSVIETIMKGFPLNTMYWADNCDGNFELIDGQQRTISICQYVNGDFSILRDNENLYFHNLKDEEKEQILNYKLMIYVCLGSNIEKLNWFRVINIAGEKLTDQELLNATYVGKWLTYAKSKFSKTNCIAYNIAKDYIKGSPIRQEFLETALDWISNGEISEYMAKHQHDNDAAELWIYFNNVINWVKTLFPNYRKEMKGINWGRLYNTYHTNSYNFENLETEIKRLMADDDVTKKNGIYEYVLSNCTLEKVLSIRLFTDTQKRTKYEQQNGICPCCGNKFNLEDMQGDHIIEWSKGGKTILENLQMLCHECHKKATKSMTN